MPGKERERRYLQLLCDRVGIALNIVREHEPPDFVVIRQSLRLGIEFTKFRLPIPAGQRPRREVAHLATSPNAKVIITGGRNGLPIILNTP